MPFNIGPGELIIVLIIALLVVGPGKLPDVGSALGKSIREFRKAATDVTDSTSLEPAQATATQAPAAVPVAAVTAPPAPVIPPPAPPEPVAVAVAATPAPDAAAVVADEASAPAAES